MHVAEHTVAPVACPGGLCGTCCAVFHSIRRPAALPTLHSQVLYLACVPGVPPRLLCRWTAVRMTASALWCAWRNVLQMTAASQLP